MIKNYLKIAFRNLLHNKAFSFINILGLAIGLTCFVLMVMFVNDELRYDRYPTEAKNIYRVHLSVTANTDVAEYPSVDFGVGEGMEKAFPEIKAFTRFMPVSDFVKYNDRQFKEDKLVFADSNFFQFFSIPLLAGNDQDALSQPNTVVISKAFAKKCFGEEDPLGKTLLIGLNNAVYKVTALFDRVPVNSHFHFEAVLSISTLHITKPTWSNLGSYTYLMLNPGADPKKLQSKFPQLVAKYVVPEVQHDMGVSYAEAQKSVNTFVFTLLPLTDIHLRSHTKYEIEPNGDIQYVYIFSALAVFILLLACVNFTNLSIALTVKRAKEVGVRKVMGSEKKQLIKQFLLESELTSFCAMLIAVIIIILLLPYFNAVAGKQISTASLLSYQFILAMLALVFFVGIFSGIYPSFFLSSFNPVQVLKGISLKGSDKNRLRSGLVVFQFLVSTVLIMGTIVVYRQINYMQHIKLGYDKEQVLFLPDGRLMGQNQDAFKQHLLQDSRVLAASISRSVPGDDFMDGTQIYPQNERANGTDIHTNIFHVDYDYLKTLGIQLVQGRNFSKEFSDSNSVVINQAAVNELGWKGKDPIGKTIVRSGQQAFKVIGVVADFHYTTAKQKVAPLMMLLGNNYGGLVLKVKTTDITGFLKDLKKAWDSFNPKGPLNYFFLDERFAALYQSELKMQLIFSAFAVLAVIIAGLGLFGLSAFIIEQRTKEIGIRKVLGASIGQLLLLLSVDFLKLVVMAFIISIPVAWWAMHQWLQGYAYRINLGVDVFLMAGAFTVLIALATISLQTIRAALSNPVKSLRTE
ncbi:MAG: ABC transporter permease [Bacteroidetes bacterium]|nr:ABC transporter permease [Bacteroidota bacterium]